MLQRIRKKGIKVCLWINPYIAQNSELFIEGKEKSYFILKENGDVWQWDMWQSGMAIVDFTNPMARTWYQEKLSTLIDMGVDCFKTDFGERIPSEGVCYYNGADPKAMHNYYSYLYNEAVSELVPIVFARSATAGGQKFPVHWGGDCTADFESMAESLRGGLSLSMCGFGYWSHDIGGFEDTSTPDVYKRWVAFGLLSSHSRMHGSTSYRVPWNYDEEAVEVTRIFIELKKRLIPYLNECAKEVNALGLPMMRSMVLEFPRDITCAYLDRQYMLGSEIIVAPIMNQEGNAQVYLPAGQWYDYFNQTNYTGERWVSFENVPYTQIPLFVKADSMNVLLSS